MTLPEIELATAADNGAANFADSATGTLVFSLRRWRRRSRSGLRTLQWIDRQGKEEPLAVAPGGYTYPRVSPDGTRVALDIIGGGNRDIWILNLERLSLTQLTDGPTEDMLPVWSPDGRRVFFAIGSDRELRGVLASRRRCDRRELEFASPGFHSPQALTPDGDPPARV